MNDTTPRRIRNNNPGNIRWGVDDRLLKNYQRLYGLNTPDKIINHYAPPNKNQTQAYIQSVAQQLGIQPDTPVDLNEEGVLTIFVKAIIRHGITSFCRLAIAFLKLWNKTE